jgi:hypothetical protein
MHFKFAWYLKMTVFWDVVPCSLVEVHQFLELLAASTLMLEAASPSETFVNFYHTT